MAKRKTTPRRTKRSSAGKPSPMPKKIFAQASPQSQGGRSLFDPGATINAETAANFLSERPVIDRAVNLLREAGFEILRARDTDATINIAGTQATFEKAFNTRLVTEERPVIKELGREDTASYIDCPDSDLPGLILPKGSAFDDVLEGIAIEEPRYFMAASRYAPLKSYWHLRVPSDISLAVNADRAHRGGITGRGIKVAMVDSGHFRHPFFVGRGYRVSPVVLGPGASSPLADESGHGTGESANVFAVAPDAQLLPVKINFANTVGAFNAAVGLQPDIITCSWGSSIRTGSLSAANQALSVAIASAWTSGIVVIFSAGNGHWGFPGQHPDVISAGGVFMAADESLRASDYSSGFMSKIYPGRRVPDLSGLVGMRPKAIYIMLPVEPGDSIDSTPWNMGGLQGGVHPQGDETANKDGWAAFSGTSAAAPQLAGAAALVKQACPRLTPSQVRDILMQSARDVTRGQCHPNTGANRATRGPDTATGNGLVDSHKATLLAKVRCLRTIGPITIRPQPPGPVPVVPGPVGPTPIRRLPEPRPQPPIRPGGVMASGEASLDQASLDAQISSQLTDSQFSPEDLSDLEEMVIKSNLDVDSTD